MIMLLIKIPKSSMHVIIFEDQAYTSDNKSIISSYKTDDTNIGNWQLTKYNSGPTVDNVKPDFFCVSREWRQIREKSQQSVESQILVMIYCVKSLSTCRSHSLPCSPQPPNTQLVMTLLLGWARLSPSISEAHINLRWDCCCMVGISAGCSNVGCVLGYRLRR